MDHDGGGETDTNQDERNSLVDRAISEVLPSDDPFDEKNFNAAALINSYFPMEQSFNSVDAVSERLAMKIINVDQAILHAVEQQSNAGTQAKLDLEEANTSVVKLMEKLSRIQIKSANTEQTVRQICSDIQVAFDTILLLVRHTALYCERYALNTFGSQQTNQCMHIYMRFVCQCIVHRLRCVSFSSDRCLCLCPHSFPCADA